jgi:hypothetical protein
VTAKKSKVTVQGEVLQLDPDDLTLGEMEEFEELSGRPLAKMMQGEIVRDEEDQPLRDARGKVVREVDPRVRDVIALVFLAKRRENPDYTLDDARKVKVSELKLGNPDPQ